MSDAGAHWVFANKEEINDAQAPDIVGSSHSRGRLGSIALSPGQDIIVPAAGRGAPWGTDLYIMNPGSSTVSVTVSWLVRGAAIPTPTAFPLSIMAGETAVLEDVIFNDFGLEEAKRRVSGRGRRRRRDRQLPDLRLRGWCNIRPGLRGRAHVGGDPVWAITNVVGLCFNSIFSTNVYATAGADGASIDFSLMDPDGIEFDTVTA